MSGSSMTLVHFIHGVGMPPWCFAPVRRALLRPSVAHRRPGYCDGRSAVGFDVQIGAIANAIAADPPGVVVGVSGGATLALAAAIAGVDGLIGIVTHEPLVGPLAPDLHAVITEGAHRLDTSGSAGAAAFCSRLYGPALAADLEWARFVDEHHAVVAAEVPEFARFAPSEESLAAIGVPHLTSLGADSPPMRRAAADVLAVSGAEVTEIAGAHHVAPASPVAFAAAIDRFVNGLAG